MTEIKKQYVFEGVVIKLNAIDFAKWREKYPYLDLVNELSQLDGEFEIRKNQGESMGKWFIEAYKRMNGRNAHARNAYHRNNHNQGLRGRSLDQELNDTSWADNN